jgi:hypothetical protein
MKLVYWITDRIGIKLPTDELIEKEYGTVIMDCRDLYDGENAPTKLFAKLNVANIIYKVDNRIIFQCQAGMSRSIAMATLLVWCNDIVPLVPEPPFKKGSSNIEDIYYNIKEKVPITQINMDLLDAIKKVPKWITIH